MYGCVVLVVGVLSTLTTARDGLQITAGELKAIRDNNGVAQCAISPPNMTVTARSRIDCMRLCLGHGCSCSCGANYHSDDGTCAFHSQPPNSFQQVSNCVYHQVFISLLHASVRLNGQARREPERGPGKHYRGALFPAPILYVLRSIRRRRQERGNVGRGVPSPSD